MDTGESQGNAPYPIAEEGGKAERGEDIMIMEPPGVLNPREK